MRRRHLEGNVGTVIISAVTLETVRNPRTNREEPKLAVAFAGKQKRLLLNKTQACALAALAGPETDGWAGRQVTLSAALAPNGAQTVAITAPARVHREETGADETDGEKSGSQEESSETG